MKGLLLAVLAGLSVNVVAIVIRHNVEDKHYLAKNEDFPPLATFFVDVAQGTLIKPEWVVTAAHAAFCIAKDR